MNHWQILQISPTNDKRIIKKAYAKLLKTTKPDKHPKDFQQLNQAYKNCLQLSKHHADARKPESIELQATEIKQDISPDFEPTKPSQYQEMKYEWEKEYSPSLATIETSSQPIEEQNNHDVYLKLMSQLDELLISKQNLNQITSWHFLTQSPILLEDEYFFKLQINVFAKISAHNQNSTNFATRVHSNVLNLLNKFFRWNNIQRTLNENFAIKQINTILNELDEDKLDPIKHLRGSAELRIQLKKIELDLANRTQRFFAFLLDMLIALVISASLRGTIIDHVLRQYNSKTTSWTYIAFIYIFMATIMEYSPIKASIGKLFLKIRVVDVYNKKLSFKKSLLRATLSSISLSAILLSIQFLDPLIILFGVGVYISILLISKNANKFTIYDGLSNTRVRQK